MHNTYGALKYQLSFIIKFTGILLLVILGNLLITSIIMHFVNAPASGTNYVIGPIDAQTFVIIFVLGLIGFKTGFRFLLANGFSRNSFYRANLAALAITSVAWMGIVMLMAALYRAVMPYKLLYSLLYPDAAGAFVWIFAVFFLTAVMGWGINMLYYRAANPGKVLLSVGPVVLAGLLIFLDTRLNWVIVKGLGRFFHAALGFGSSVHNPYIGALTMLVAAAFLCGCNYLLLRRAQIKE